MAVLPLRRFRRSQALTVTSAVAAVTALTGAALSAGPAAAAPRAASAGRTITITPADVRYGSTGADTLAGYLQSLRPGDRLVLKAGIYNAGYTRPNVAKGTSGAPITVIAEDPSRTLIRGQLKLWDADHWRLHNLRIRATVQGGEALFIGGGRGWVVSGGEFLGARDTKAYTNVGISDGNAGPPTDFRFTANCVHGAAKTTRENQDHNIYVNFRGTTSTRGTIDRNVVFDHPNGVGLKLGFGGAPKSRGPWGVQVTGNTIANGGRQILLHGDVRNNVINNNLLAYSTKHFQKLAKTTAIYANMLTTRTNTYRNNYVYKSSMVAWDPAGGLVDRGDNKLRGNPSFAAVKSCSGYQPKATVAKRYGRYAR